MRTKSIAIIVIASCAVVVAFCASVVWFVYSIFTGALIGYQPPPTPAQLKEPRIVIGKNFLARSEFVKTTFLEKFKGVGVISDVAVGEFDPHPGLDVIVAGSSGALVFDRDGTQQGRTVFQFKATNVKLGPFSTPKIEMSLGDVKVVDLEADGVCEYVARGGMDGGAVFDHQGKMIWTYGKYVKGGTSINDLTVGDLDGDGIAEFVVSWHGIEVFDKSGKRRSQLPEKYSSSPIEVVDTNGDGKNEIVSIDQALRIRDATGQVIKSVDLPVYVGQFSLCKVPDRKAPVILGLKDRTLWLIDFEGKTVAQFNAPLSKFDDTVERVNGEEFHGTSVYKSKGVWIKLAKDRPEYLAVINEFVALDRSVFDIFTPAGELVYQEVLPEECMSIAILPPADPAGVPDLLVAGERTVWRYRVSGQ